MEGKLYQAARIAEFCGVTRQYINRYCKEHCPEARSGRKIDISHPTMIQLMESKGVDLSKELKSAAERTSHLAKKPVSQSESSLSVGAPPRQARNVDDIGKVNSVAQTEISEHGGLTINEIAAYYGDHEQYRGWLAAKKQQVEIIEREIKVKERLGDLVSRDLVSKMNLSIVDGFTSRLLTDFCKSTPIDLRAAFESGKDNIEIEVLLRSLLSNQLGPLIKNISEQIGD